MDIEKRVYSSWAFSADELKKRDMNISIYNELREKYKIATCETYYNTETKTRERINEDEFDIIVTCKGSGYAYTLYEVIKNVPKLSTDELALICDDGNLCFGYDMRYGWIAIHTD